MNNFKTEKGHSVYYGEYLQTQDNNYSLRNKQENEVLTAEFNLCSGLILVNNQIATFEKIKKYIAKKDRIKNEEELRKAAADAYIKFREARFIDDNCKLIKGIDEAITEYIS